MDLSIPLDVRVDGAGGREPRIRGCIAAGEWYDARSVRAHNHLPQPHRGADTSEGRGDDRVVVCTLGLVLCSSPVHSIGPPVESRPRCAILMSIVAHPQIEAPAMARQCRRVTLTSIRPSVTQLVDGRLPVPEPHDEGSVPCAVARGARVGEGHALASRSV